MGWATGSEIFENVLEIVEPYLGDSKEEVVRELIELFEDYDCDTLGEVSDPVVQQVLCELYPDDDVD